MLSTNKHTHVIIYKTNPKTDEQKTQIKQKLKSKSLTVSLVDEVIEGVAIAIIRKSIVGGGEFLKTLGSDALKISGELGVLSKDHGASSYKAID